jgi:hypothetical protein
MLKKKTVVSFKKQELLTFREHLVLLTISGFCCYFFVSFLVFLFCLSSFCVLFLMLPVFLDIHLLVPVFLDIHLLVPVFLDIHLLVPVFLDIHLLVPVFLDIHLMVSPSVFSNVYFPWYYCFYHQ